MIRTGPDKDSTQPVLRKPDYSSQFSNQKPFERERDFRLRIERQKAEVSILFIQFVFYFLWEGGRRIIISNKSSERRTMRKLVT